MFTIVKYAQSPEWEHYFTKDPKVVGVNSDLSAMYTHTGFVEKIRLSYDNKDEAREDCKRMNVSNPSGYYAVCPVEIED